LSVLLAVNLPLIQLAQTTPSREDAMREGMSLLMMVSLIGVVVVTILALWMVMRGLRRKKARGEAVPTDMSVDPWVEAGKRMDDGITEFDDEL